MFSFPFSLPDLASDAPESWRLSRLYDGLELGGDRSNLGYVSAYSCRAQMALDAVRRYSAPGGRILDIAAGQGNFSLQLASEGYRVTWNDLREELADYIRLKSPMASSLDMAVGNAFELDSTRWGQYDVVLAAEVIEHTAHPDQFLQQAARFARPDGAVVVTSPNGQYFRNALPKFANVPDPSVFEAMQFKPDADGHIFLIWRDELDGFAARAGLKLVEFRSFTNPLTAGHIKLAPLLRVLPARLVQWIEATTRNLPRAISDRLNSHWLAVFRRL